MRGWLKRRRLARRRRAMHNDRDYFCRYWWGDRGGYKLSEERCLICHPLMPEPPAPRTSTATLDTRPIQEEG